MIARSVCVFAGPSLPLDRRLPLAGVTFRPAAKRGDVGDAAAAFDAILLIDGVFHHELAPSPREVALACERTRMFGAASMGALRAAECARYGMVGLGAIARWYACERIDGDDEVAVMMDPGTQRALSTASVDVRHVAWLAQRRKVLSPAQARRWCARARTEIFYADRTWDAVLACAPAESRTVLRGLARVHGDLKGLDARFALRRMQRLLART